MKVTAGASPSRRRATMLRFHFFFHPASGKFNYKAGTITLLMMEEMWKLEPKRRIHMSFPLRVILLVIIFYLFAPFIYFAVMDSVSENAAFGSTRKTDEFSVKSLKITGNTLISTRQLLEKLPLCYIDYEQIDPNTEQARVNGTYDFRVLYEIILRPGKERFISLEEIQGLTKYILSQYSDYAGIYVYVPADPDEGTGKMKLRDGILEIKILEGRVEKITVERYDLLDPNQTLLDPDDKTHGPEKKRGHRNGKSLRRF